MSTHVITKEIETVTPAQLPPELQALLTPESQAQELVAVMKVIKGGLEGGKDPRDEADATALPGPLKEIFATQPDIPVGEKYKVRPFLDIDFIILEELDHPLAKMMKLAMAGKADEAEALDVPVRGQPAWTLCYVFTRSVDEVEAVLNDPTKGKLVIEAEAKKEFSRFQVGVFAAITHAVTRQVRVYWSAILKEAPEDPEEGAAPDPKMAAPEAGMGAAGGSTSLLAS